MDKDGVRMDGGFFRPSFRLRVFSLRNHGKRSYGGSGSCRIAYGRGNRFEMELRFDSRKARPLEMRFESARGLFGSNGGPSEVLRIRTWGRVSGIMFRHVPNDVRQSETSRIGDSEENVRKVRGSVRPILRLREKSIGGIQILHETVRKMKERPRIRFPRVREAWENTERLS